MTQFPWNPEYNTPPKKGHRKLLLSVCEISGENVIGVECVYTGDDVKCFENLPDHIYQKILSLVDDLETKKRLMQKNKQLNEPSIEI